jgi:hypothetical protein
MNRWAVASVLSLMAASWIASAEAPTAKTHQVRLNGHVFTLPAGFEIELAAGPPLVNRPIAADFVRQHRKGTRAAREEAAPHRPPGGQQGHRPLR